MSVFAPKLFKQMVKYSNSNDEKELSKSLHKDQPYFCNIIDPEKGDCPLFPKPLRSLAEIRADILALEKETEGMLKEVIE